MALGEAHPRPPPGSRLFASARPRRWLRTPSSPPRCLGAPQYPAPLPAPPPPCPASPRPAFPRANAPALPTPTLPSAGRAAARIAGPVTHRRAVSAQAQEPQLEHGRRQPSPRGLSRVQPRIAGSAGGRGRGRGRRGLALTRLKATDPSATAGVSRWLSLARPPCLSRTQPTRACSSRGGAQQASLPAAAAAAAAHPAQRDPALPAFAVRLCAGAGLRACAPPSTAVL